MIYYYLIINNNNKHNNDLSLETRGPLWRGTNFQF